MKAKELRIGNIVSIFGIEQHTITELKNTIYVDLSPIPLTEEWLLNLGFDKEKDWNGNEKEGSYELNGYYYITEHKNLFYVDDIYDYTSFCEYEIKYVHQLQNLYFALTGEELKILKDEQRN